MPYNNLKKAKLWKLCAFIFVNRPETEIRHQHHHHHHHMKPVDFNNSNNNK